jgi:hypothetical protein
MDNQYTDHELQQRLAQHGVNLNNARHRKALAEREAEAVERAKQDANPVRNPQAAKRLEAFIENSTIVAVAFTSGLFSLVLFGLFAVETIALVHGMELLLRTWEALVLAPVILGALYVTMFLAETLRPEAEKEQFNNFSLRVLLREVFYLIGLKQLRSIEHPEYRATRAVERFLAFVVVSISIIGRLSPLLLEASGLNVADGVQFLMQTTSLLDLLSAIAIGAATIAAISSSHFIYAFTWRVFQKTTGGFDLSGKASGASDFEGLREEYLTESRREYLTNLLAVAEAREEAKQKQALNLPDSENSQPPSDN